MAYINIAASLKNTRCAAFNTALGGAANVLIYSGALPESPDVTPAGTLLGTLPLSATPGVVSYGLEGAVINAGGSGTGTSSAVTVTGTTGTGTKFAIANCTVTSGVLTALGAVTFANGGTYSVLPSNLTAEPVTLSGGGVSVTGATLSLEMTANWVANAVTTENASAGGTATFARLATSGGAGILDGDVGTSGTTFTINSTTIVSGGPIVCSSIVFSEV